MAEGDSLSTSLGLFYADVKTGGPFDLKNQPPLQSHSECGVKLYGRPVSYDVPGNISYGFEGVKFLEEHYVSPPRTDWTLREFLLAAAGTAQFAADQDWENLVSVFTGIPTAGLDIVNKLRELDNPCDANAIAVGIEHAYNEPWKIAIANAALLDPLGRCTP